MQIRHLNIQRFRGICALEWCPDAAFCCLIGAGDVGKSTVLDAIEATLSSRWFSFSEPDLLYGDSSESIVIEVTLGELSKALKSDHRFGLYVRGWTAEGTLRDEPEGNDEPVLTVRLTVDATIEPVWQLVCDRFEDARILSNRDRASFGLVRLAGDDARHLAWGQGSILARMSGNDIEAAASLAGAYRAARASANLNQIKSLADAAALAEEAAKGMGAYVDDGYQAGLELGRSGFSSGSIALHDGEVPLRLAGLGTRRLASLAIQKLAISEGAIILIDEIEHGLEPHRVIGAISQLKADQVKASALKAPIGQVLMTTHSDVALGEAGADALRVVQNVRTGPLTTVTKPPNPKALRTFMRFGTRALFARRILVMEGQTEVGMLLGIREFWPARHGGKPIEQLGAAIADGRGANAPDIALCLKELGYAVAMFRDSDRPLSEDVKASLQHNHIEVFEYGEDLHMEHALFLAADDSQVQALLEFARVEKSLDKVNQKCRDKLVEVPYQVIAAEFDHWADHTEHQPHELRLAIGAVAAADSWYKEQRIGRELAPLVWKIAQGAPDSALARTLAQAETWLYA